MVSVWVSSLSVETLRLGELEPLDNPGVNVCVCILCVSPVTDPTRLFPGTLYRISGCRELMDCLHNEYK